jgi:hypothetical protein
MLDWIHIDWSQVDKKWLFTTLLALYGAVLSTYREISARWAKKAKAKIYYSTSWMMIDGAGSQTPYVHVRIMNTGQTDLHFSETCTAVGVKRQKTTYMIYKPLSDVTFPYTLKPGAAFYIGGKKDALTEALKTAGRSGKVKTRAVVFDSIGRQFTSKWVKLEL